MGSNHSPQPISTKVEAVHPPTDWRDIKMGSIGPPRRDDDCSVLEDNSGDRFLALITSQSSMLDS